MLMQHSFPRASACSCTSLAGCSQITAASCHQRLPVRAGAAASTSAYRHTEIRGRESSRSIPTCDVVLSSGFLAFAHHSGFLQCVEEAGIRVGGVMGTSAGALAGSLYCAGYSPHQVAVELSRVPPIQLLRLSLQPWQGGILSLDGVVEKLRDLLPPRFEDLPREFAVGVVTADGQHKLIDRGPLPEAVAASAAIPLIFQAVAVPGQSMRNPLRDGGLVDRVGVKAWRERRRAQASTRSSPGRLPTCLVHVIDRSSPFSGDDDTSHSGEAGLVVVHSPRSGVNFFSLGDFEGQFMMTKRRTKPYLDRLEQQMQHQQQLAGQTLQLAGQGSIRLPSRSLSPPRLTSRV